MTGVGPRFSFLGSCIAQLVKFAVAGVIGFLVGEAIRWAETPRVSIQCPSQIGSHEYLVQGTYRGQGQLAVYVAPQDRSGQVWRQDSPVLDVRERLALGLSSRRAWSHMARFGNPYGLGHRQPPPLDYLIYAALFPAEAPIPGRLDGPIVSPGPFDDVLVSAGATVATCKVLRTAEPRCDYRVEIVQPRQTGNPWEYARYYPSEPIDWRPSRPVYLEVWRDGSLVFETKEPVMPPFRPDLALCKGQCELKLMDQKRSSCQASLWFAPFASPPQPQKTLAVSPKRAARQVHHIEKANNPDVLANRGIEGPQLDICDRTKLEALVKKATADAQLNGVSFRGGVNSGTDCSLEIRFRMNQYREQARRLAQIINSEPMHADRAYVRQSDRALANGIEVWASR